MRFTKASDTIKSKLLILLPAFLWVISLTIWLLANGDIFWRVLKLICLALSVGYILVFWEAIAKTLGVLNEISAWQQDRVYFETEKIGETLEESEKILTSRAYHFGKKCEQTKGKILPVAISRKCSFYVSSGKSFRERFALLYSVDKLDEKLYEQIVNASKVAIKQNHAYNPYWFIMYNKKEIKKGKKLTGENSSVSGAVIIICNSASQGVEKWVRRGNGKNEEYQILPCVCTLSDQKCYFDAHIDYGLFKKSKKAHNRAVKMIKKIVFGGILPLSSNENYLEKTYDERYEEMSIHDLFMEMRK